MQRFENGIDTVGKSFRDSVRHIGRGIQNLFHDKHTSHHVTHVTHVTASISHDDAQHGSEVVPVDQFNSSQSESSSQSSSSSYYDSEEDNQVSFTHNHRSSCSSTRR